MGNLCSNLEGDFGAGISDKGTLALVGVIENFASSFHLSVILANCTHPGVLDSQVDTK